MYFQGYQKDSQSRMLFTLKYYKILSIMQFNSDRFTACSSREKLCFVTIEFNLFQCCASFYFALPFTCIPLKTKLRFV